MEYVILAAGVVGFFLGSWAYRDKEGGVLGGALKEKTDKNPEPVPVTGRRANLADLLRFSCPFCQEQFNSTDGKHWHISDEGDFEINCTRCQVHLSGKMVVNEMTEFEATKCG